MINVVISKNKIEAKGHANYDVYNKDIVCASFTTAVIVSINLVEKLKLENNIKYVLNEGHIEFEIIKENDILKSIFENLEYTINDLSLQYPKNIKILK